MSLRANLDAKVAQEIAAAIAFLVHVAAVLIANAVLLMYARAAHR